MFKRYRATVHSKFGKSHNGWSSDYQISEFIFYAMARDWAQNLTNTTDYYKIERIADNELIEERYRVFARYDFGDGYTRVDRHWVTRTDCVFQHCDPEVRELARQTQKIIDDVNKELDKNPKRI